MWGHRGLFILALLPALVSAAAQAEVREAVKPAAVMTLAAADTDTGLHAAGKVTATYALHAAAIYNRPKAAKLLIAGGMQVDLRNEGGLTPLMVAATFGNVEVAEALIADGCRPHCPQSFRPYAAAHCRARGPGADSETASRSWGGYFSAGHSAWRDAVPFCRTLRAHEGDRGAGGAWSRSRCRGQ